MRLILDRLYNKMKFFPTIDPTKPPKFYFIILRFKIRFIDSISTALNEVALGKATINIGR